MKGFSVFTIHSGGEIRYQCKTPERLGAAHAVRCGRIHADAIGDSAQGFGVKDHAGKLVAQHYRPFIL